MDIARTPLAGRQPENLGEDPFLAGHTVAAEVRGVKSGHAIETLKHYVANNQEYGRTGFARPTGAHGGVNAIVSERALQEIYEAPFKRAIRESGGRRRHVLLQPRSTARRRARARSCSTDLKASGFDGFVVPDFVFAVRDPLAATLAGVDVPALGRSGGRTAEMFTSGQVPAARLDDIVRRMLFAMFDCGVFDDPVGAGGRGRQHAGAPGAGDAGVGGPAWCCCKNDRHALPLGGAALRSLAVIGPSGDDAIYISGGSSAVTPAPGATVTPLAGIRARAGPACDVTAAQGSLGDVPLPTIVPRRRRPGFAADATGTTATSSGAPALTRTEPTVDLAAAPAGVGPLWSARWTGTVDADRVRPVSLLAAPGRARDAVRRRPAGRARLPRGRRSSSPARSTRCRPPCA